MSHSHPFAQLVAGHIMHRDPICAAPLEPLEELRQRLVASHVTGMPVVDKGKLVGVISRSDLSRVEDLMTMLDSEVTDELAWQSEQADGFQHAATKPPADHQGFRDRLSKLCVRDAMRRQVITCRTSDAVVDVARQMIEHRVHRIIVVEGDRPVGIISAFDLARLVADGK